MLRSDPLAHLSVPVFGKIFRLEFCAIDFSRLKSITLLSHPVSSSTLRTELLISMTIGLFLADSFLLDGITDVDDSAFFGLFP